MASFVTSEIVHDGHKNTVVKITGCVCKEDLKGEVIVDVTKLTPVPRMLKIDDVVFAIKEKLACILWWKNTEGKSLIFPLEGRGKLDFFPLESLQHPDKARWAGQIVLYTEGATDKDQPFMFMLNLTKQ